MRRESPGEIPEIRLEARWPIMAAIVVILTITLLRPAELRIAPAWLLPALEVALLACLVAGHPAQLTRRAAGLRALSIAVVAVVLADTLAATKLVPWAKIAMAAQSLISIAVLGLVIARAVNVFT